MAPVWKDWCTPTTITATKSSKKHQRSVKPVGESWARSGPLHLKLSPGRYFFPQRGDITLQEDTTETH